MSNIRIRLVKHKRFIKPYEIEISINHKKYIPLFEWEEWSIDNVKFWSLKKAEQFVEEVFYVELETGAKLSKKVKIYERRKEK